MFYKLGILILFITNIKMKNIYYRYYGGDTLIFDQVLDDTNTINIDEKDDNDITPLHLATLAGRLDNVNNLLQRGAFVNAGDIKGCTPLHLATKFGYPKVIEAIVNHVLQNKQDSISEFVNIQDNEGRTSLHYAIWKGNLKIMRDTQSLIVIDLE
jgi:ankyrin repeat protein